MHFNKIHFMRWLPVFFAVLINANTYSQVFCIECVNQTGILNPNAVNMIINGSFENNSCSADNSSSSFNPLSIFYNCDIAGWTSHGGGVDTRSCTIDTLFNTVPNGNVIVYFGNSVCKPCSSALNDISCLTFTGCKMPDLQPGFPINGPNFGNANGVTLEQMMSGLVIGNAYTLEFWAGGECFFSDPGLFAVDVGFGNIILQCEESCPYSYSPLNGKRYMISFIAAAETQNLKFTSWGHVCSTCTQVCLDDVILYKTLQAETFPVTCFIPCSVKIEQTQTNVFSPNNDGVNDLFFPFLNLSYPFQDFDFKNYNLQIFDRWGNKVFETSDLDKKSWNGITSKNKKADSGVYYWIATGTSSCSDSEIEKKGFVSLVR